jgi:hypothetical protein
MSPAISISCRTRSNRTNPLIREIEPHSPEYASKPRFFPLKTDAGESDDCKRKLDLDSGDTKTGSFFTADSKDCFSSTTEFKDCSAAEGPLSDDEESAELDQELSNTTPKTDDKIEYLKLLPNEVLEHLYDFLDIDSQYHFTSLSNLFLTHRDKAVVEYRKKEVREKIGNLLNHLSKNLHLLDKKEIRDKVGAYLRLLERTSTARKGGEKLAAVDFDEKTIAVAIKLVMHNNESEFNKHTILRDSENIPGNPNEIIIKYDHRRVVWGMGDYDVLINYKNQGMGFETGKPRTYCKFTRVPRSFFNGITDEKLIYEVQKEFVELEKKNIMEKWKKTYSFHFFRSLGCVVS